MGRSHALVVVVHERPVTTVTHRDPREKLARLESREETIELD